MNRNTKITLDEIIRRKEQMLAAKKKPQRVDLYIPSLDGCITIEEPSAELTQDAAEIENSVDGEISGDAYMCYQSIKEPNLKAKELQEAFGCSEPMDIVNIMFKPGEIQQISQKCMELAGYNGGVETVDNIKN